ncbi:carboxynorspermidine decarboxylase, partial [Vibrio harveyi]
MQQNELKTPY